MTLEKKKKIAVIIASKGRPQVLEETLRSVLRQTRMPDRIIVSVSRPEDFPLNRDEWRALGVTILDAPAGLCAQLNHAIDRLEDDIDYVCNFDDDVELEEGYLSHVEAVFKLWPSIVAFGGEIVFEGSMEREEARNLLHPLPRLMHGVRANTFQGVESSQLIGCNINIRAETLQRLMWDEQMNTGNAWLADLDLARRAMRLGQVFHYNGCRLVHLQAPAGRLGDRTFGRLQVVHPFYMWRKGMLGFSEAILEKVLLSPLINFAFCFLPDKRKVNRWGRLLGNVAGFWQIIVGRVTRKGIK